MKKILKLAIPLLLVICLFMTSFPTGAATLGSLSKNPVYYYGVDVSEWNGDLNWTKLRDSGVEFAYIRIGYYHTGKGYIDERFKQNVKACVESGIDFGVYVYSYVYTHTETVKCANWVKSTLASMGNYTKDKDTIQVAYDIEDEVQKNAVAKGKVTRSYLHNGVQKFCDTVKSGGYVPVVYSFSSFFNDYLYLDKFMDKGVKIWYASWPYTPNVKVKKKMDNGRYADVWQFSSTIKINGGIFDANVCYDDFYNFAKEDSKLKITGLADSYAYNKSGVKPDVKVYNGTTLLKKGTDYKVVYFKNKQTGRARMKIIRYKDGKYLESKSVIFYIRPVAVKNFKATPAVNSISLQWDKLNGALSYQIEEFNPDEQKFQLIDTISATKYTDYFLDEATEYKIRVRAVTKIKGKTVYGSWATVTTSTRYKSVKLNSVKSTVKGKATLNWNAKTSNTKGYYIEYAKKSNYSDKKTLKIEGMETNTADITKLTSGTKYYVRVRSYNVKSGKTFYSLYSTSKSVVIK